MRGNKLGTFVLTLCFLLLVTMTAMASTSNENTQTETQVNTELKINEGVYIDQINLSGLSESEARALVESYINELTSREATLIMDQNQVAVSVGELGYFWANTDIISEAVSLCKTGNIIKRYKDKKDIEKEPKVYNITFDINTESLTAAINTYCLNFNTPHVNPDIVKQGSSFTVVGQDSWGRVIDVNASIENIKAYLINEWNKENTQIELVVVDDKPSSTIEECQRVKDLLGTYSTSFSATEANFNRNMNIKNGARLINGTVVYPGETFSANDVLNPFTPANGYYAAGTYENGRVVDSIGGGICQVSSTLYNALLLSELEIVERSNHSMSVGYVPLAADAALAGSWKDLKFKNNTEIPIYIEAVYAEGRISFSIYGEEYREAGRTIKYVSETLSSTPFTEVITEDPSKPIGYRAVTQNGHTGYVAKLWKFVYKNGAEQSKELVNKSSYQSSPAQVTIGTAAVQEETTSQPPTDTTAPTTQQPTTQPTTVNQNVTPGI